MSKQPGKRNSRSRAWIFIVIALIGIAVAGYFYINQRNSAPATAQYQTSIAEKGTLTATIGATGTVRSNQTAIMVWQNTGTISNLNFKRGDMVKTGDSLGDLALPALTQSSLESNLITAQENLAELTSPQAIANAELAVTTAEADVTNAQYYFNNQEYWKNDALIQDQYAKLVLAKDNLDRAKNAYDSANVGEYINNSNEAVLYQNLYNAQQAYDNANYYYSLYSQKPTQRQYDEAQAKLELAKATLTNAQNYLAVLIGGEVPADATGPALLKLKQARLAVQTAQDNLDATKITSPINGMVTEVNGMVGDQVAPGTKAFRIDDLSKMKVDVQVSEVDINSVQVGQPATLTFDAIADKTYNGKVVEVAQAGNSVQGAVNFTVTVELVGQDASVKPGMTAAVTITVKQITDVLLVPNRAVRLVNNERVVYILNNEQPQEVKITLGASSDTVSEVVAGDLKAGDQIILNPPSTLFNRPGNGGGGFFMGGG
jgi:HlyD family secretion protein